MGVEVFLAYIFGILMLFFIAKLLLIPIKIVWKLIVNAVIGGITLILINLLGAFFGLYIPINIITALITGVLGVPGVVLILILQYIL